MALYINRSAGFEVAPALASRIFDETEGHPFFLSEMVALMAAEGVLTSESISDVVMPDGVREALGRRLDRLPDEANDLLRVAAVIGREFSYDLLALLGGSTASELLDQLEAAIDARVIEELREPGRYRFTHALMQETLLDELSTTRRVRIHGDVGDALERRWGAETAAARASRLAQHFVEAAILSTRHQERGLFYSRLAAEDASRRLGWEEAIRHYENALRTHDELGEASGVGGVDLLRGLALAQRATSRPQEAFRNFRRAMRLAQAAGDRRQTAELAIEQTQGMGWMPATLRRQLYETALEAVDDRDGELALMAHGGLVRLRRLIGDQSAALHHAEARRISDAHDFPAATAFLLGEEIDLAMADEDEPEAVAPLITELEQLEEAAGRNYFVTVLTGSRSAWHLAGGDLEAAEREARKLLERALEAHYDAAVLTELRTLLTVAYARGAFEECDRLLERYEEHSSGPDGRLQMIRAVLAETRGDLDTACEEAVEAIEIYRSIQVIQQDIGESTSLAVRLLATGETERARSLFDAASARYADMPEEVNALPDVAKLALGAVEFADGDLVDRLLPRIEATNREFMYDVTSRPNAFLRERVLGVLKDFRGSHEEAVAHLEAALSFAQRHGFAVEAARSRIDLAAAVAHGGGPEERRRAFSELDQALAEFQTLGMPLEVQRVIARKLELQGAGSDSADPQTSLVSLTTSVESDRPDVASAVAPDGTVTLLFSDIEDSTAMNVELGDDAWMQLLAEHNRLVRDAISATGGFEVKTEGDAFMVAFGSARDAVRCAQAMQRALDARNGDAERPLRIRIGLHTGEPIREADDFYGTHVVLAARICSQADGGEILVSSLLRDLVASSGEFELAAREPVALKGLDGEHVTYLVGWA